MKLLLTLTAFFLGTLVSASSGVERNADRFARGLPPLPPANLRRSHGSNTRSKPSPLPCAPLKENQGYIEAYKSSDGSFAGFLSNRFDDKHAYTLTTSRGDALQLALPSTSPFSGAFNILAVNGPDNRHPYFGAVGGSNGYHLGKGQEDSAYLAGTDSTPGNSPPSSHAGTSMEAAGYRGPAESQIWSMDCRSLELSAQWTNVDNGHPDTTIFYSPSKHYVGLTSDLDSLDAKSRDSAYAVTFKFVPGSH